MNNIMVGLFGSCGNSVYRKKFIEKYNELEIEHYNPQVEDWKPEFAQVEAEHLATDKIIVFPITSESYGLGSLSEMGFSILNAIRLDRRRHFVVLIDSGLDSNLTDKRLIDESIRGRELLLAHLKRLNLSDLYIVNTLDEMLEVSIALYNSEKCKESIMQYSTGS